MWNYYKHGFEAGMRVKVIRQHKYKSTRLVGKLGTVKSGYGTEIMVILDDIRNVYSAGGHYYFKPSELEILNEAYEDIKEENDMPNVVNYLNAVKIQFVDNTSPCGYIYANFEPDVTVGDLCVVKSAHHGLGLAKIVEVIDKNDFETSREIVAKVYKDAYDTRVAYRVKAAELKAKMHERAKQLQDIALYQMLAKDDSEMMALLDEYQAIPKL